jgi:7-cyano-7-deazaguanine synthase
MSSAARNPVAILLGGGVESTWLVAKFLAAGEEVVPVHVYCGLIWDACESRFVRRFCAEFARPALHELIEIRLPLADFLNTHWAVTARKVPAAGDPAAKLEIPLRNLTLLSFALHCLPPQPHYRLALGTTADNSYRDGSRAYFDRCQELLSLEIGRPVQVLTPLIELNKVQIIRDADPRALALSFSCVNPRGDLHCGVCIKCGRRQSAFAAAGIADPTTYAVPPS